MENGLLFSLYSPLSFPSMNSYAAYQQKIGFTFQDVTFLQRALTHRSYLNEVPDHPFPHNERLEFLGDAIIDFIVGEYLFHQLPAMREGDLTLLRARLVSEDALAGFATRIELGQEVLMGRGEEVTGGRTRAALLADSFEALIAAMYLDQGMGAVMAWVQPLLVPVVAELVAQGSGKDARTILQEVMQGERGQTPRYIVVGQEGPDHERIFTTEVRVGDEVLGVGKGRSKQLAAQAAAQDALERRTETPE
jgi:ribonuclease III